MLAGYIDRGKWALAQIPPGVPCFKRDNELDIAVLTRLANEKDRGNVIPGVRHLRTARLSCYCPAGGCTRVDPESALQYLDVRIDNFFLCCSGDIVADIRVAGLAGRCDGAPDSADRITVDLICSHKKIPRGVGGATVSTGGRANTAGSATVSAGSATVAAGSRANTAGSGTNTTGSGAGAAGSRANTAGSGANTAGSSATFYVRDAWPICALSYSQMSLRITYPVGVRLTDFDLDYTAYTLSSQARYDLQHRDGLANAFGAFSDGVFIPY